MAELTSFELMVSRANGNLLKSERKPTDLTDRNSETAADIRRSQERWLVWPRPDGRLNRRTLVSTVFVANGKLCAPSYCEQLKWGASYIDAEQNTPVMDVSSSPILAGGQTDCSHTNLTPSNRQWKTRFG